MKPLDDALREAIDSLRKLPEHGQQPNWRLDIFRNRERMMGLIQGARIENTPELEHQPTVVQRDDGVYHVMYTKNGGIYRRTSGPENVPSVEFGGENFMWDGFRPDLAYDGSFDTVGQFSTGALLCVYEQPEGTIRFRRNSANGWGDPVTVTTNGDSPSIVRGWADPPEVGSADTGLIVMFIRNGRLMYTHSDNGGNTWADAIEIDQPSGGTKSAPQIFRLSDYTLGFVYAYDNDLTSEVYFHKTTRRYVNIASPDEVSAVGLGRFHQYEFVMFDLEASDELMAIGLGLFMQVEFSNTTRGIEEEFSVGAGNFIQVEFTGVSP